jgi:hypothetical protein
VFGAAMFVAAMWPAARNTRPSSPPIVEPPPVVRQIEIVPKVVRTVPVAPSPPPEPVAMMRLPDDDIVERPPRRRVARARVSHRAARRAHRQVARARANHRDICRGKGRVITRGGRSWRCRR